MPAEKAAKRLDAARRKLRSGDAAAALEAVAEVISETRPTAARDPAARAQLAAAMELAAAIESSLPQSSAIDGAKPTAFQ